MFKDKHITGFNNPIILPKSAEQAQEWQRANKTWWEDHPMRYDWKQKIFYKEFTPEFYRDIDQRFFSEVKKFMPWKKIPFDTLINFDALKSMEILEIGVGNGSCASLLAQYAKSFKGIDITEYAVKSTSERMRCFGIKGEILQMDVEHMKFNDNAFDFIWSWGVIHHTSDTRRALQEMHRVLKPGGKIITMVYHRNFWNYYIIGGLIRGILLGGLSREKSLHAVMQRVADGAIARFYSISEWHALVSEFFHIEKTLVLGNKSEIIPLPLGKTKNFLILLIPNSVSRFLTNRCKMGGFLVTLLTKHNDVRKS